MTRILSLVLACTLLAACGQNEPRTPAESPAGSPPTTAAVTDCGTFTLDQGDPFPADGTRCLITAAQQRRPARLQVTRPTTEGDMIPETYTAQSDGRVEVVTDSRQDNFGAREITRRTCDRPSVTEHSIQFGECTEPVRIGK